MRRARENSRSSRLCPDRRRAPTPATACGRLRFRHRCATAVAGPPRPAPASERGSTGSCSNVSSLVAQPPQPAAANRLHLQGFRGGVRPLDTQRRELLGRRLARFQRPLQLGRRGGQGHTRQRQFVEHHLAELACTDRRQRLPVSGASQRRVRARQHTARSPGQCDTPAPRSSSRELEAGVSGVGDLVAASAILRDSARVAHVHPFLAGNVAAVVPGVAGRMD